MVTILKNIVLLCFLPNVLFAQLDSIRLDSNYLKKYWDDAKLVVSSPLRWKGDDWAKFGIVTGTTAALFLVDEPIQRGFQDLQSEKLGNFSSNLLEPFGAEYSLAVAGSFALYGAFAEDNKSLSTGLLAVESFLLSSIIVQFPKRLIGRQRPDFGPDVSPFEFEPIKSHGLPSGHTTAVFSVATVIATQYSETVWVPVVSYSIATLAGLSRVYDNRHWFSDVFAGAALGYAVGKLVTKSKLNKRVSIIPFSNKHIHGVKLALTL